MIPSLGSFAVNFSQSHGSFSARCSGQAKPLTRTMVGVDALHQGEILSVLFGAAVGWFASAYPRNRDRSRNIGVGIVVGVIAAGALLAFANNTQFGCERLLGDFWRDGSGCIHDESGTVD
jgi:hypothetical protein